ncbi:MAG: 50S ribosomal protein L4 [Alphaproteobacteria bacterium RIFCSPLOWO2_01_FULL_40_26]|nr:MAG: 50S ribosomal protein L4 [Alphaproteobacteria bacterium RIFCSPHIGHO2_02_FULL_40_34]OFW87842.1 MAG: 50S ribosomal protein L4 [Alphaproteobacteria bacterium RIFCSPHIGHO2_01_FULL_40_8]OFW95077.1 MAG: 50S ribosomal protein L4 [Alphaproteobacteria bacterium RIFCSPLOWO2_01_FULL_40_26]OFX09100.1 MAG: 50S ribosomal protein L4 [Alphaproteobacteria bacterium RIFCSPLOWO2_02_FULL_40_19]OFX12158.1 MAG: 50S ribosomal protein L4 [Alphaproteobacteria bacterium RIFCSPLOWO2_12_FULL_40_11]
MSSISVKTIDFGNGAIGSKKIEFAAPLEIKSAKSVAYVIRWQLARRRAGSAKTKTMAEISGTTAKPWKQKGTGRARQGSRRSVQFVGGRTCHGPMPRSFDFSMPKKIVKIALSDVLKLKLREGKVTLFSDFGSEIKTAKISSALSKNQFENALIIHQSETLAKSAKNLKNVKALDAKALNVYDILNFDHLLVDEKIFEPQILAAIC